MMARRALLHLPLAAAAAAGQRAAAAEAPLAAQPATLDWPTLQLLDGRTLAPADWQGRPAVVVLWATWCPYCQRHNAHVDALHRAAQGLPGRVLGVALDRDADAVRRHLAQAGLGFAVALDDGRLRPQLSARRVVPLTCLVNAQGRVLQALPGEMARDDVMGLLRHLGMTTG